MTQRPIMDAGPGLNFFSLNQERLLFSALGPLCVPEVVKREILRKSREDLRFAAASRVWAKLPPRLLTVLSDDTTDELASSVQRISGIPLEQRVQSSSDLGETMVIAHAAVAAERGEHVLVLIDDQGGAQLARREAQRLRRLHSAGRPVGTIRLVNTRTVLERAAGGVYLPDRKTMQAVYNRLRRLDDGLPPLAATNLMTLPIWP